MINLIPPEGFRVLKHEYLLRVGATCGFLGGGVLLIFTTTLAPTYILTHAQIQEYQARVDRVGDEAQSFADAQKEVEKTQTLLVQLYTNISAPLASNVIREIERVTPNGITFKTFYMESTKGVAKTVQLQGTASTRESLIQFKNHLEASEMFEKAGIPIADLARDVNLPFAFGVTFASTTQ